MRAYRIVFARYGVKASIKEIAFHFGDWEAPKYWGIKDIDGCLEQIDTLAIKDLKKVALHPGVKDVLDKLVKDKHLALLSSSPREILDAALRYNRIYNYFEVILAGEDVKHHKPHPEVIYKGLKKLKGTGEKAVMIGDSRKDLEAAKSAGIDSILFYPKKHKLFYDLENLKSYNPTYIVSDFNEILPLI